MKEILQLVFGVVSVWNLVTIAVGVGQYLNSSRWIFNIIMAILILGFMIGTKTIWKWNSEEKVAKFLLISFWIISLVFSLITTYQGNLSFIFHDIDNIKIVFLIGITLLTASAPILFSLLIDED